MVDDGINIQVAILEAWHMIVLLIAVTKIKTHPGIIDQGAEH